MGQPTQRYDFINIKCFVVTGDHDLIAGANEVIAAAHAAGKNVLVLPDRIGDLPAQVLVGYLRLNHPQAFEQYHPKGDAPVDALGKVVGSDQAKPAEEGTPQSTIDLTKLGAFTASPEVVVPPSLPKRGKAVAVFATDETKRFLVQQGLNVVEGAQAEDADLVIVLTHATQYADLVAIQRAGRAIGKGAAFLTTPGLTTLDSLVIAAIRSVGGKDPVVIEASEPSIEQILQATGFEPDKIALIGRDLDVMARLGLGEPRVGITVLVPLFGEVVNLDAVEHKPDIVADTINDILAFNFKADDQAAS
jgi:hypothetical protein